MDIKIINAKVLLFEGKNVVLSNKEVGILNGKIIKIEDKISDTYKPSRVIDFKGDILAPSFINGHTHSAMTLFRGVADDLPLDSWLFDRIFPMEAHLTPEDIYYGTYLAIMEYLSSGISLFADMYFMPEVIAEVAKKAKMKCILVSGTNDIGGDDPDQVAALMEERFNKFNNYDKNISYMLGLHAEYTCSQKLITNVADLSYKYKAPTYIHLSETLKEVGDCTVKNNGLTPPMYLHKLGYFDNGGVVAHGVYLDKDDMEILKSSNISVVTNPASNLKLASGIAPLYSMENTGLNISIGTDGAASNNSLDMFREMYLSSVLQKYYMKDASLISAENVLRYATINGARAFSLNNTGEIKVGNSADLIRIDVSKPHFYPQSNLIKNLVFSANKGDVLMTMVNGEILYENGEYNIGINKEEIYSGAKKCIKRLLEKANFNS